MRPRPSVRRRTKTRIKPPSPVHTDRTRMSVHAQACGVCVLTDLHLEVQLPADVRWPEAPCRKIMPVTSINAKVACRHRGCDKSVGPNKHKGFGYGTAMFQPSLCWSTLLAIVWRHHCAVCCGTLSIVFRRDRRNLPRTQQASLRPPLKFSDYKKAVGRRGHKMQCCAVHHDGSMFDAATKSTVVAHSLV